MGLLSTRRELIQALLGGAVAAGCARRTPSLDFEGGFVGDDATRGHRLRDAWRDGASVDASAPPRRARVVILGGGVSGLTAAWALRRAGIDDLLVLELADEVGGTARGGESRVSPYPWGAHYVPAPTDEHPDLVALLQEMGAVDRTQDGLQYAEQFLCAAPQERIFADGTWQPGLVPRLGQPAAERAQWRRFEARMAQWIAFRDAEGRRAFTFPIANGSDAPEVRALDTLSFAQWLDREGFDAPSLRWYADYACRDDFGARPEEVSAYFGLHYMCARTPAPGEDSAPFLTWPQGNARVVEHLARRVGAERIRTGHGVARIEASGAGARIVAVDLERNRRVAIDAERVVFALPTFQRRFLLPEAPAYGPDYAPWLVLNLHLAGRPASRGFETAWDNVIRDSRSLGYVVANHQTGLAVGPTVWTWYLPLTGPDALEERRRLEALDWRSAADAAVHELDRAHLGLRRHLRRVDARRWGHGMVKPQVGLRFSTERAAAAAPWRNVHFAHTDLSGVALIEEAVFHGVRAAREVRAALGGGA